MLVLLIVLLGEHALLLAGKLALSISANLAGLVESTLALSVDGLHGEGVLLRLLRLSLALGDLRSNRLGSLLSRKLRDGRLLRSGWLLGLNRRLSGGCDGLAGLCRRRRLVFVQRLGRLTTRESDMSASISTAILTWARDQTTHCQSSNCQTAYQDPTMKRSHQA